MIKFLFSCFLISTSITIYAAGVMTVPERLFRMTDSEVNITEGDLLYKSQAAGYYTGGGGMVVRSPVKTFKLANAHLPQIQSGCGGIDIYTGGFSFINGKQLVEALQSISSNAQGFAFMLGLESISPAASNTIRQLQSWANAVNDIGINSCEKAAQLVGSIWPANEMASQHICRTMGASGKQFHDYVDGRHQCALLSSNPAQKNKIKEYQPLEGDYNIAWESLRSQPYFRDYQNLALAEMYMTLVGTFVVKDQKAQFHFSKAEEPNFLKRLLEGGMVTKYTCKDKDKCLEVIEAEEELNLEDSWFYKIRRTLANMQQKAIQDEPLDSAEKGLLCTSRLPLAKIVNVLSAYHRGKTCAVEMDSIAEIITWDVLAQVINEAIETVRRGCLYLQANSIYRGDTDRYLADLERVRKVVQKYEAHAHKAIDLEMRLIQKMQLLEKQINSEIMVY